MSILGKGFYIFLVSLEEKGYFQFSEMNAETFLRQIIVG